MSESISSKLAVIYLKNQDLSNKTPEELYDIYFDAYNRISAKYLESKKSLKTVKKSQFDL